MPTLKVTIEYPEDDDKPDDDYEIEFEITSHGSPAHMGSLTYAGDPGDPAEYEIETVYLRGEIVQVSDDLMQKFYEEIDNRWDPAWDDPGDYASEDY